MKLAAKLFNSYLRRKQKLHLIQMQKPLFIHYTASFAFRENIKIGKYCRIGHQCHLDGEGGLEIGDGTILSPNVVILTSSHDYKKTDLLPYGKTDKKASVIIGSGCWIGWGAMICPGVRIMDGAIVAMGSVVTKDVLEGEVVGGNPAIIINKRDANTNIRDMVKNEQFFLKSVIELNTIREGRKSNGIEYLIR